MRKMNPLSICVLLAMAGWLVFGSQVTMLAQTSTGNDSGATSKRECPLMVGSQVKMEVTGVVFMDEVQGTGGRRMTIPEDKRDKWRLGIVTLKVTKPAGTRFTLAAADLALHYYHGEQTEVAPCEGLSSFSSSDDSDRPMELSQTMGPGFTKQTTGAKTTQASVIYMDAVFGFMEPDTSEIWVCLGQPVTDRGFTVASGLWK